MSSTVSHTPEIEKAGVIIPWFDTREQPSDDRRSETAGLVQALGCELAFLRDDRIRKTSPSHLLSGGVLQRFGDDLRAHDCTIAIIDGALSPIQQRNLERSLGMKVIDRTGLILEIFGLRAKTKEGVLQVELARLMYERSRLVRTWTHLERQRGGRGFLGGPGETQLESDKRMLDRALKRLKNDLEEVRRTRGLQRMGRKRRGTPIVALVGYTNAGKSTLFNRLAGANVFAKDMPFATLDPTIRQITLPNVGEVALVDTVGFISDLPTHLIDSFKATLEEAVEADLLLHVRDRSSASDYSQKEDVLNVLEQLETQTGNVLPPIIEVWNKADCLSSEKLESLKQAAIHQDDEPVVLVSALTGYGISKLIEQIEFGLRGHSVTLQIHLKASDGRQRAWLHQHSIVESEKIEADGSIKLSVRMDVDTHGRWQAAF